MTRYKRLHRRINAGQEYEAMILQKKMLVVEDKEKTE